MNCSKTCSQAYVCLTPIVILATALYHIPGRGNNMQSREVKGAWDHQENCNRREDI